MECCSYSRKCQMWTFDIKCDSFNWIFYCIVKLCFSLKTKKKMTRLHHFASCLTCVDVVFTTYSLCAHSKLQGNEKFSFSSSLWMTDVNLASSSELKWFFQSPATPNINKHTRTVWWTQQIIDVKVLNAFVDGSWIPGCSWGFFCL